MSCRLPPPFLPLRRLPPFVSVPPRPSLLVSAHTSSYAFSNFRSNFPDAEKLTSKQWVDQLISIGQGADAGSWAKRVIIGGCCGTAIDEIAELRKGVDAL